jgi:hypothetical protein
MQQKATRLPSEVAIPARADKGYVFSSYSHMQQKATRLPSEVAIPARADKGYVHI